MTSSINQKDIQQAASLIRSAKSTSALTGAGISTPSGIPDFRSQGSGLWERYDPMQVASLSAFRYHPERFLEWVRPLAKQILEAKPNAAHYALASLERENYLAGVVTQNIDNLHQQAGSKHVLEIHGHLREAACLSCFKKVPATAIIESFVKDKQLPFCDVCGGILKPQIVLFGEQLPQDVVQKAQVLIGSSDLILVLGSSLEVTPAALFPVTALNAGAALIIINQDPTYLDERADLIFHQDLAEVLPLIAAEVLREPKR